LERWPDAELTGVDSSADMIDTARRISLKCQWLVKDIGYWVATNPYPVDLILSNAALQWLPDHAALFPALLEQVAASGALAVQMPNNLDAPPHRVARDLAASDSWRGRFVAAGVREWHVHDTAFYYDLLAPQATRLDFWETEYVHVMDGGEQILEWYKGSGLRPYFAALSSANERDEFAADYLKTIRAAYPRRTDGRILFSFRRLFLIAYRR
jgi:trans-aconitate 2-methyltransferase